MQITSCTQFGLCPHSDRDLIHVHQIVYQPNHFFMSNPVKDPESKKYGACRFILNSMNIIYRVAHITPRKSGQFVTLWKRAGKPFDSTDPIDLVVITVRNSEADRFGQFVFPKKVLLQKNIISNKSKGGRRAMRVYCPWDATNSRQAKASQAWQLNYFLEIPLHAPINIEASKRLYSI